MVHVQVSLMDSEPTFHIGHLQGTLRVVEQELGLLRVQREGIHHEEAKVFLRKSYIVFSDFSFCRVPTSHKGSGRFTSLTSSDMST